jgi:hypothetical protein
MAMETAKMITKLLGQVSGQHELLGQLGQLGQLGELLGQVSELLGQPKSLLLMVLVQVVQVVQIIFFPRARARARDLK